MGKEIVLTIDKEDLERALDFRQQLDDLLTSETNASITLASLWDAAVKEAMACGFTKEEAREIFNSTWDIVDMNESQEWN